MNPNLFCIKPDYKLFVDRRTLFDVDGREDVHLPVFSFDIDPKHFQIADVHWQGNPNAKNKKGYYFILVPKACQLAGGKDRFDMIELMKTIHDIPELRGFLQPLPAAPVVKPEDNIAPKISSSLSDIPLSPPPLLPPTSRSVSPSSSSPSSSSPSASSSSVFSSSLPSPPSAAEVVHFPNIVEEVVSDEKLTPTPAEKTLKCLVQIRDLIQDLIDELKEEK
jgi:hypothetical protein